jgi:hypothetical protein
LRLARAALAVTYFVCSEAVDNVTAGFDCRLALPERTLGFCAAGLARAASRGASTVTGGSVRSAVCALVIEGIAESVLQSTAALAPPRAR